MKDAEERAGELKLFVVGESSGDPENWSGFGSRVFVIASNAAEALALAGDLAAPCVAEVDMTKPSVLVHEDSSSMLARRSSSSLFM